MNASKDGDGDDARERDAVKILVVEDEPRIGADICDALKAAGMAVDLVADGEEAWFRGDTETYDAAVLDLGLPKLDGLTVLRALARGRAAVSGAGAHRARRVGGAGGGHQPRRRRLPAEAVRNGGTGGAAQGSAPPLGGTGRAGDHRRAAVARHAARWRSR